jgi:hypothetical protein
VGSKTKHAKRNSQTEQKRNKAIVTRTPGIMCATIAGQAANMSQLAAPVTLSPVTTEQGRATKTKKHLGKIQK